MLRRSTKSVSGVVDLNRVVEERGMHRGIGDKKNKWVAVANESVELVAAEAGSEEVVDCGKLDAAIEAFSRRSGSEDAIFLVAHEVVLGN